MDLNLITGALAVLATTISVAVSLIQLLEKRKAEDKFSKILREYLEKEPTSKNILNLTIRINQHMSLQANRNKQASQVQQKFLEKNLELNTIQSEFIKLTENLAEKDKALINEGLIQPSTTGRLSYMAKLLEKAKK